MRNYTVVGFWPSSMERFADVFVGESAREAEEKAQIFARCDAEDVLCVVAVIEGVNTPADRYTLYVDPEDRRNRNASDVLEPDFIGVLTETYTVVGAVGNPGEVITENYAVLKRYLDQVETLSPGTAETVARDRVETDSGQLLVCSVFLGEVYRTDRYATLVNPELREQ